MRPQGQGALPRGLARGSPTALARPFAVIAGFLNKTFIITELELRKLRHDPTDLLARTVQPVLWLLVFGEVFTGIRAMPTGGLRYLDFMAPGILAQSVLFVAIFNGIAVIWERDLGIIHKFLVSPTPRMALALGKALSGGIRALPQAAIVYGLALVLGVKMDWSPAALLGVLILVLLGAAFFSAFSLIIAFLVKTRERFMGMGQVLTMPLFFASNALYPVSVMPGWLKVVSHLNPLSYEVDGLRALMLAEGVSSNGLWLDFAVLVPATLLLVFIAGRLYPRIVT